MQGKQNATNLERKGPHKSMHCKFCKPPGVVTPEKVNWPQFETKTKIHLTHEAVDLKLCDIHAEPGVQMLDSEACVCVLEGESLCPKCNPDKNRIPPKKKVCRCPKGAKPHQNMKDGTTTKKKRQKEEDDEFWWEKYSREHDALTQETWAAYVAHRNMEKKLAKVQKLEKIKFLAQTTKGIPAWYQKLSCQQMIYVEFLSTAIRLDSDENITERTLMVLGGIGLYPRPNRKILKKCLKYCHYNAINFLNQLHLLTKDLDPFEEKKNILQLKKHTAYSWNERLIMNSICHLEFPMLLRELMDRLPPFKRGKILPQIPYPVFPKLPKKSYENPYEEPIWQDHVNWIEKAKIDRLNRCRLYMNTKRVKIPPLALVKRPSLIDARPFFLPQIEANERASKRIANQKERKISRKNPISTFNSSVDVTAIAGIEASEISTTEKPDADDICVFLREPLKEPEFVEEEEEKEEEEDDEVEMEFEKEVRFTEGMPEVITTQISRPCPIFGEYSESEMEDIPFKSPPKTESGNTIEQPCLPPNPSPGPLSTHYRVAKRELDIINQELCGFYPFVSSSEAGDQNLINDRNEEITLQLLSAAEKLKQFSEKESFEKNTSVGIKKKKHKKLKKKLLNKRKNKVKESKTKSENKSKKWKKKKYNHPILCHNIDKSEEEKCNSFEEENADFEEEEENNILQTYVNDMRNKKNKEKDRNSLISDPDPDSTEDLSDRLPCVSNVKNSVENSLLPDKILGDKKPKKKKLKGKKAKKKKPVKRKITQPFQARSDYNGNSIIKAGEEVATEYYTEEFDNIYDEKKKNKTIKKEQEQKNFFQGKPHTLLKTIIKDLAEEGFVSAKYKGIAYHPDIDQLVLYLKGKLITKKLKNQLYATTKDKWAEMKGLTKFSTPDLGISSKKANSATWNDRTRILRLAKAKINEFYFKAASVRNENGRNIYTSLFQNYFGSGRYLKIFYAYMISKYEDAILRGIV